MPGKNGLDTLQKFRRLNKSTLLKAEKTLVQQSQLNSLANPNKFISLNLSAMMKADDKERVLPDDSEKVPKIQVFTSKALKASKKPAFAGCLGIALACFAIVLSLIVLISVLGYIGYLPQKVTKLLRQLLFYRIAKTAIV